MRVRMSVNDAAVAMRVGMNNCFGIKFVLLWRIPPKTPDVYRSENNEHNADGKLHT